LADGIDVAAGANRLQQFQHVRLVQGNQVAPLGVLVVLHTEDHLVTPFSGGPQHLHHSGGLAAAR
jgi:hypothetical protein